MAEREMVAPCGIYCPGWPGYQAQFDPALAEELAKRFNMPREKVICPGCRPAKGVVMGWTRPCPTYTCVEAGGLEFCYQCGEFPCLKLAPYLRSQGPITPRSTTCS